MTRQIPDIVRNRQIKASDPRWSSWVTANAGSGKTHVLAQRVIRLLLRGVDPGKILCITFTKAAAANMAMRVFNTLASWTALDDDALDDAIRDAGDEPGAPLRAQARRLFAQALETPGGLKVQTIHAFCTSLLHQFPSEANVAARFQVLDEATEHQILDSLVLDVLLEAASKPETAIGMHLKAAIGFANDQTFRDVIKEAVGKREEIAQWIRSAGSLEAAMAQMSAALGVEHSRTRQDVENAFFQSPHVPVSEWATLIDIFSSGSTNDQKQADRLASVRGAAGQARIDAYLSIFCSEKGEARKAILTKALVGTYPELSMRMSAEQERVRILLDELNAITCRDRSAALIAIAHDVITRYATEKDRRGLLDYDDLIVKASVLLTDEAAAWVHYKLDLGINHVLIDEAQDISPQQWEIVRKLTAEFTAGAGARGRTERTIFAVGDEKQAIFSFQGSAPHEFAQMRRHFAKAHADSALPFEPVVMSHSFRSGEIVLGAVDAVFSERSVSQSVTMDADGVPPHTALEGIAPGVVEIWDPIESAKAEEKEAWDAPFDQEEETSPRIRLARKIAHNVRLMLRQRPLVGRERKPLTPRGILILVRQRGPLFEAIIRALKDHDVAVAGADRMILTDHIAVMDLMALADALLLPEHDLALATVLKSPLFGFDDDDLFAIAWERGEMSLHESLVCVSKDNPRFASAVETIDRLADDARRYTPFTFFARLLGPGEGRKRILSRLGHEANDALDEFLNLALTYESRETPSLQGFIAWLRAAEAVVKRDMEIGRDEVRVMTVHGAKGLEAPIVILADTTTPPKGHHSPRILTLPAAEAAPGTPDCIIWAGTQADDCGAVKRARDANKKATEDEYRRLLYVAMTRAEERLIVCGIARRKADGTLSMPEGCWYHLISDGLQRELIEIAAADGEGIVKRFRKPDDDFTNAPEYAGEAIKIEPATMDERLARPMQPSPQRFKLITPSTNDEVAAFAPGSGLDRATALAKGRLIHRLMQSLPDVPSERRTQVARDYLARRGSGFTDSECDTMLAQVLALLDDPQFAPLFAPGSRAEVPLVGYLGGDKTLLVSGQIDRLVVTSDVVLVADYKTNSPAPRVAADAPPAYLRQLALYRALLRQLYPGRPVRTALVWTEIPDLMEIPAHLLDTQLATLTSA